MKEIEKPFKCPNCHRTFEEHVDLLQHFAEHEECLDVAAGIASDPSKPIKKSQPAL